MGNLNKGHISQEAYDAVCLDRDRWVKLAMDQYQYIRQLEQEILTLKFAKPDSISEIKQISL